jgi:hypothetical protein
LTISDSGYAVSSDGLGSYRSGSANVRVVSGPGAILLLQHSQAPRSFIVDLDHPVPGDIGHPLGKITVDGVWPGRFIPSGTIAASELSAFYFAPDSSFLGTDIPVGTTVQAGVGFAFFLNGVGHALWAGPEHFTMHHCLAAGTWGAYSTGTTPATLSRPTASTWVVDLPPGSIGRLFGAHSGGYNNVNEGLYYVSLRFVIQQ